MLRLLTKWHLVLVITALLSFSSVIFAQNDSTSSSTAVLLKVKGGIGPAISDYIDQGIAKANKMKAGVVILQLDTPGGLSKSMRDIIKSMLSSSVPILVYVAPSGARAASAGTYILYAAQLAAMAPGTNLGAATPVAIGGGGLLGGDNNKAKKQPKKLSASEKKALNDARAYIRSLAELHGRNIDWAEQAVRQGKSLTAVEALKLNVINLIAENIPDLLQKANGKPVKLKGRVIKLKTAELTVVEVKPGWRARFLAVITDPSVAYILLMLGIYGIFFEFLNPGFVAPGVIGGICLLIGLYALALLPINYAGLALLLLGIALIIAEAFVSSFGILGLGGVISFVVGSIFLMKTEYSAFQLPVYTVIAVTVVTLTFMLLILSMAIRSRRRPAVSGIEALKGKVGRVQVDQKGKIWLHLVGENWQCRSKHELKSGDQVVVKEIEGLTLVVEPLINNKEE